MQVFGSGSPWLDLALTHRSVSPKHNERLEFLGDALLGFVLAEEIWRRFPEADEGLMTLMRSHLVNQRLLAALAREQGLDAALAERLLEGKREIAKSPKVLAGVFEAAIAAVYLDSGIDALRAAIEQIYQAHWASLDRYKDAKASGSQGLKSAKARLQEYLQKRGHGLPSYTQLRTEGQDHQLRFFVECRVDGLGLSAVGTGKRRRHAQDDAAAQLCEQLPDEPD